MAEAPSAADALYAKPEFAGYSLWVVPEAQAESSLADVIRECAQRLQTPSFSPHMTLLGGVTVRSLDLVLLPPPPHYQRVLTRGLWDTAGPERTRSD